MNEHGRIIGKVAKAALQPIGFRQKSRSRIWFADEGLWLSVVEFQPSSWSKGSYLNVAVHWLWGRPPYVLSFDRVDRVNGFIGFDGPEQFTLLMTNLVKKASEVIQRDRSQFKSIGQTANFLIQEEQSRSTHRFGWGAFNAGVAAGLAGMPDAARAMLEHVREPHARPAAESLLSDARRLGSFEEPVKSLINAERAHLGLMPLSG